jgi:hypothetical protein
MAPNTSEISLNNDPNGLARPGVKVNLRLWSDTTSFGDVRRRIALVPEIIANKGDARMDRKGVPSTRAQAQPGTRAESRRNFFIFFARNPLKRLDCKK